MAKQATKQAKQVARTNRAKTIAPKPSETRIPWAERKFRVLSNPNATPKMHETLESACAHAKRHVLADREPIVERLENGKWVAVNDWFENEVSADLAYRW